MDIFAVVAVIFLVLLGALAMAATTMQQNGQLREIQAKLSRLSKANTADKTPPDAEALRIERAGIIDPLVLMEVSLGQAGSPELTEEQFQQIDSARTSIKSISEQLKTAEEWMGPPYDLEWIEQLDRMPRLKAAYLKLGFRTE